MVAMETLDGGDGSARWWRWKCWMVAVAALPDIGAMHRIGELVDLP